MVVTSYHEISYWCIVVSEYDALNCGFILREGAWEAAIFVESCIMLNMGGCVHLLMFGYGV